MRTILVDLETQSACDLKSEGAYKYISHESTRLMSAVFLEGTDIYVWIPDGIIPTEWDLKKLIPAVDGYTVHIALRPVPPGPIRSAIEEGATFVAHNADSFDRIAWERFVPGPQPEWYDTIHACRASGLPAGLDKASRSLGGEGKDKPGSRAMNLLMKATTRAGNYKYPKGTPKLWRQLLHYNVVDVLELNRVYQNTENTETELLQLHRKINSRGIPVDTDFARHLRRLWDELGVQSRDEVAAITDGRLKENDLNSPAKVKAWLARKGCPVASLARAQIEQMISDPDSFFGDADTETVALVHQVLLARQQSVRTSPAKLERIFNSADSESRVKNCFVYYGAHTGRWSARELQPHNFPRGLNSLDVGRLLDCWGAGELSLHRVRDAATSAGGSPGDALGTLLRPVICAPEGKRLVICDYASVEARCVAWLARDDAMLAAFKGRDIYCEMASTIFGREVTKEDKAERFVGKITVLGCGYQMGARRFSATAKLQGCDLDRAGVTGEACVKAFRAAYPRVPGMWGGYDNAFRRCVEGISNIVSCRCRFTREGADVCIELPSGRKLRYRDVKMESIVPVWGGEARPTPTYASPRGFRKVVYGGYITENISQAVCRDLLADAMTRLDAAGWDIVMHVHDEIVIEASVEHSIDALEAMLVTMSTPPAWAARFPLSVEGFVSQRYVKNPLPGSPHGAGALGEIHLENPL